MRLNNLPNANATEQLPYTVDLWGSNPDETDNDDCWTGESFATHEEATTAYQTLCKEPTRGIAKNCPNWAFAMIDGPDVHAVMANPDTKAQVLCCREDRDFEEDWKRESTMQSGMAFGVNGYNDEYGY